ncbi:MAG: 50S ribosomal protein L25/general stress protein Ctc [Pseudomonadota bacterium]
METFEITAQRRTDVGKGASRRLRHAGYVPAIIYGSGKEPVSLTLPHNELLKQLEHEGFYSHILTVNIDGQPEKAVLKDLQRHPYRPAVMHLDLLRVSETQKLHMRVPLHFINENKCAGVKQSGGVVSHHMTDVEISCLPKDLPEFIEVDLLNINLNEIIHLSHLVLPEGAELFATHGSSHDLPVVSVHLARGNKADEEEEAETAAAEDENKEGEKK